MSYFNRNNSAKKEYDQAVMDALKGKLAIDDLANKIEVAQIIVVTLFKEAGGAIINIKQKDGSVSPMKFEVINGVPDITRYKLMPNNEDSVSSTVYTTINSLTGIDGRGAMESFKEDLVSVEGVLVEALEAAYNEGHQFIFTQGISFIYPCEDGSEGPLVITGLVDANNDVVFKYATTSSVNLTFKDDYAKVSRI